MDTTGGPQYCWLDVVSVHRADGRQERPLIRVRLQLGIDKHTAASLAWPLLQRQRNQVPEPAFGHRVLVGEQPVVGVQLELPHARARMADDGGAQAPRVAGRNPAGEEYPGVSATPGARNLQRRGHAKRLAGLHECSRILPPFRFIEVDGDKVAAVIFQQGVNADSVLAGQMAVDDRIG
jgi:hypothetical protein